MLSGRGVVRFLDRAQQDATALLFAAPVDATAQGATITANGTIKIRARFPSGSTAIVWNGDKLAATTLYAVQQVAASAGALSALRAPAVFPESGKVTVSLQQAVAIDTDFLITAFPAT